jgi:hypothetical protein
VPPHRISRTWRPIASLSSEFGYRVGYRAGPRVVPIPYENYHPAEGRVNIGLSPKLVRAPVACLPPAARLFWLPPLHYRFGIRSHETLTKIRAADAIAPPTAPIGAAAAPLTASGNRCAQNWLSGFLATATNRCRNRCELVSGRTDE